MDDEKLLEKLMEDEKLLRWRRHVLENKKYLLGLY